MQITDAPSPNHDERRHKVDMLVLHYTGMETGQGALDRMRDPEAKVSAHYMVWEDGRVVRLVDESRRAWHAGLSSWQGDDDLNSRSIGIEIVNPGHEFGYRAFPDVQIDAVMELSKGILSRHRIPPRNVIAHSDIAPGRKEDPGELFPWKRLAGVGIGIWVEAQAVMGESLSPADRGDAVRALQVDLAAYGYGIDPTGDYEARTRDVVIAFQRHFRPVKFDGVADAQTQDVLRRLLATVSTVA